MEGFVMSTRADSDVVQEACYDPRTNVTACSASTGDSWLRHSSAGRMSRWSGPGSVERSLALGSHDESSVRHNGDDDDDDDDEDSPQQHHWGSPDNAYNNSDVGLYSSPDRFVTEYEDFRELGRGDFGTVTAARSTCDGKQYAVKRSLRSISGLTEEQHLLQEVYALSTPSATAHVLRYFDAWIDDGHLYIVTELVSAGSVSSLTSDGPWCEDQLWHLAMQAAMGVHALHCSNVAHLDIKPDNLLCRFDDGQLVVKIGDFGLARPLDAGAGFLGLNDDEGDARYLCPELLRDSESPLLKEADMYALGMSLLDVAGGDPRAVRNTGDYSCLSRLSPQLQALIERMTCHQPTGRPTAFDVVREASWCLVQRGLLHCDDAVRQTLEAKFDAIDALAAEVRLLEAALDNSP